MIYYTMTHHILALIQQPPSISNCFFGIETQAWGTFVADVNLEIKIPGLNKVFNFPNILQYNFIKDEKFEEETLSSKSTAKYKDFTLLKFTSNGFFL